MTYANSPELFIRNIAESMENHHYMQTPGQYITEAFVNEALKGYDRIDEGFMDVMKTLLKPITWPIAKIADFWKKDRGFVNEVSKAEKAIPKHVVAALYSEEFADTNIVQDLWDMLCMLKDVVLFRYRHIPWRTAISAAGLVLYYLSPWNLTLGTALANWLASIGTGQGSGLGTTFLGDGSAATGVDPANGPKFSYDNVQFPEGQQFNAQGLPVDTDGNVLSADAFKPAAWNSPEYEFPADQKFLDGMPVDANGEELPMDMFKKAGPAGGGADTMVFGDTAKLDPGVEVGTENGKIIYSADNWSGDRPLKVGTTYDLPNGGKADRKSVV